MLRVLVHVFGSRRLRYGMGFSPVANGLGLFNKVALLKLQQGSREGRATSSCSLLVLQTDVLPSVHYLDAVYSTPAPQLPGSMFSLLYTHGTNCFALLGGGIPVHSCLMCYLMCSAVSAEMRQPVHHLWVITPLSDNNTQYVAVLAHTPATCQGCICRRRCATPCLLGAGAFPALQAC